MPDSQQPVQPMLSEAETKLRIMKATAVNQAVQEIMQENRNEIVRRAREKLLAMEIRLTDAEVGL